jgi:hypothetical protein
MPTQAERFASCVKKISKNFRPASRKASFARSDKEGAAIAICTKSILWPQGRTLKHFSMKRGKPVLITQPRKGGRTLKRSKK